MSREEQTSTIPRHVAVIMDGNGRWAAKRRLGRVRGHREGIAAVRRTVTEALNSGVSYLTLFAFSSENWGRPKAEVDALMNLLATNLVKEAPELAQRGVRIRVIGDRTRLPLKALKAILRSEEITAEGDKLTLSLAISYGGRDEILHAVRGLLSDGVKEEDVTEETLRARFYAPDIPDPDLLIRTSGEYRISNFLLWQLAYTELYVTEVLWPDFGAEEFKDALNTYASRERRFGRTAAQVLENN